MFLVRSCSAKSANQQFDQLPHFRYHLRRHILGLGVAGRPEAQSLQYVQDQSGGRVGGAQIEFATSLPGAKNIGQELQFLLREGLKQVTEQRVGAEQGISAQDLKVEQ